MEEISHTFTLFEGSDYLMGLLSTEGEWRRLSSASAQVLGAGANELQSTNVYDLLSTEQQSKLRTAVENTLCGDSNITLTLTFRNRANVLKHTEWTLSHPGGSDSILAIIKDVTGHFEDKILQDRLLSAIVNASGGVCLVDYRAENHPIVFVNEKFCDTTGYSKEEILGQNCRILQGGDQDQPGVARLREALKNGESADVVIRNYRKDGKVFWNKLQISPVFDDEGTLTHYIGYQTDITQQHYERQALRESQRMLQRTQEFGRIGAWEYTLESKGPKWSEELFRIHGLSSDSEITLDQLFNFYHPASAKVLKRAFDRCLEEGEPFDLVLRLLDTSGNEHWVRNIGEPDSDQVPARRLIGTMQDITDAVETSLALRGSEYRFRKAFEGAPHGMAILAVDGQLLNVNSSLCRILDYSREQLIEKNFENLSYSGDRDIYRTLMNRLLQGELPSLQLEIRLVSQEGRSVPVALSAALVYDINGQAEHLVAHIVDLTVQKRLEEEQRAHSDRRRQAQKLESLGLLAGGIAHDFNNLLTSIMGNVELAMMDIPRNSPARDCLQDVQTSTQRAAELCNQMLAYAGKGKFLVQPTNLSELVWEMCRLLAPKIPSSVSTRYLLAENIPPVEADATQLRQVVMNLLTNATEAIEHRGGSITISTEAKYCDEESLRAYAPDQRLEPGSYVLLQITDTGSGMSTDTLAKIFDPFFTTKFTGRGLGLAAVLGIVKAHHGAIHVSSEPSKGTTMTVLLPALGSHSERESAREGGKSADERIILVVDDDKRVLKVGERILSRAGYTVLTAEDGRIGLHVFRQRINDIDAVLLDMTMPHLSGHETFKAMNELRPDIPVLLTSGYTSGDTLDSFAPDKRPAGFIQKPYRPYELLKKIEDLIGVHPGGRTSSELRDA